MERVEKKLTAPGVGSKITLDGSFLWPLRYVYKIETHSAPATTEDVAHTMCRAGTCLSE